MNGLIMGVLPWLHVACANSSAISRTKVKSEIRTGAWAYEPE